MELDVLFICFVVAELLLYLFHLSVLILLLAKRKSMFCSPFFTILRIIISADLISFVALFSVQKLTLIPFIYDLYKQSGYLLPSIIFSITTCMTCFQFLGHVFLAFNSFTLICYPIKHKLLWSHQWYTVILIIASFLYISWKIAEPVSFVFLAGTNVGVAIVDKNTNNIYYVLSTSMFLSTTLITAFLNVITFFKFYFQKKTSNNIISIKERNLLYLSFFVFISQIFRTSFNINRLFFADNAGLVKFFETIVPVLYDIYAWSGSVSLLILSASTRKQYSEFYFCKSKNNAVVRFTSTA